MSWPRAGTVRWRETARWRPHPFRRESVRRLVALGRVVRRVVVRRVVGAARLRHRRRSGVSLGVLRLSQLPLHPVEVEVHLPLVVAAEAHPEHHIVGKEEVLETIRDSTAMPDWAKAMAHKAISEMDYDRIAAEIAATRIKQIKTFLGRPLADGG